MKTTDLPSDLEKFKQRVINDGIVSIETNEPRPAQRRGSLHGFELCRPLNTLKEFEDVIVARRSEERRMITESTREERDDGVESYWEYRYATLQVEFVYERMKAIMAMHGLYEGALSALAVLQTAHILGLENEF